MFDRIVPCEGCGECPIHLDGSQFYTIEIGEVTINRYGTAIQDQQFCCSSQCVQHVINEVGTSVVQQPDGTSTVWLTDNAVKQHNDDNRKAGGWSGD